MFGRSEQSLSKVEAEKKSVVGWREEEGRRLERRWDLLSKGLVSPGKHLNFV